RILRALARPDLIEYDQKETSAQVPVFVPCPPGAPPSPVPPPSSGPRLALDPACGSPGASLLVLGEGFPARANGRVYFVPPNGIQLSVADFRTDAQGAFTLPMQLPERPSPEAQTVLAVARENTGAPRLTRNAYDTWDKIIETVFMALLGTTFGTMVAVPLSFLAARNLMKDVTGTVSSLSVVLIALPLGGLLGASIWRIALAGTTSLTTSVPASLGVTAAMLGASGLGLRWALPAEEVATPGRGLRLARAAVILGAGLLSMLALVMVSRLMVVAGNRMVEALGIAGFIGSFLASLGQVVELLLGAVAIAAGGVLLATVAGGLAHRVRQPLSRESGRAMDLALAALAGAVGAVLLGELLGWLYQWEDPRLSLYGPALVGALAGLVIGLRSGAGDTFPVGLVIYNLTRTVLNVLRAIEPVIMVIVIAVWVGIGPFAGVLALSLHTVAALGKLFSEDVETISAGPLEAVTATGATRLQMIIYAVVPQIVPTYVSLTMYRWDINVRMSTIIGFAGGGGIGFLLQQNANLLNYRAASAQILAIALVVTAMDYLSSYLRAKAV
ncbi:MAG TPA: ABC transporter permease subunit, partial [Anaerolineales bacterium]|nr:ABC transporter permease subunit [Anaerolineales bacterium]